MSNLGNLWFGADIDLTQLKQKISQGNQSILDALKMNYDDKSYQEMVSRLRSSLGRETFTIKINTDVSDVRNSVVKSLRGGGGNIGGIVSKVSLAEFREVETGLRQQRAYVTDLKAQVRQLALEYQRVKGQFGSQNVANALFQKRSELIAEQAELTKLTQKYRELKSAMGGLSGAKSSASQAAKELTNNSIRLNATLAGGIHVSSRLGSALNSLFAVGYVRSFLDNVIEIGGQLEKQRISLGAILGDAARANQLFEQIKGLAVKSPFGVVELDQYTKQLAAYGFKSYELFDMTKRLADISAGAGTDISRLANALGHVRSETALTGITLRQFSMNNIPMLKMLSKYYTEVEKKSVTVAEVRKRISKKEVSYEDVITQIKRLTDEGGMFYEMQEKISESLQARRKNFKDSLDIMYGEIAESGVGDLMKSFFETLTDLSRNWKILSSMIMGAVSAFGVAKLATMAFNHGLTAQSYNLGRLSLNTARLTAQQVEQLYISKRVTEQQILEAVAAKKLSVSQAELAAEYMNVSRAQLMAIANAGRVGTTITQNAIATSRYTRSQLETILATKKWVAQNNILGLSFVKANGQLNVLGRGLMGLRIAATGVATALKAVGAALKSFAPALLSFAAFEALFYMISKYQQQAERVKEINDAMLDSATESIRNIKDALDEVPAFSPELDIVDLQSGIEQMVDHIRNYSIDAEEVLGRVFATDEQGIYIMSLEERYKALREEMEKTLEVKKELEGTSDVFGSALAETNGYLKDNLEEDAKDFDKAKAKSRKAIREYYNENKKEVERGIKELAESSKLYGNAIEGMVGMTDKLEVLLEQMSKGYHKNNGIVPGVMVNDYIRGVGRARKELDNEIATFSKAVKEKFAADYGYDFGNLTAVQISNLKTQIANFDNLLKNSSESTKEYIKKAFHDALLKSPKEYLTELYERLKNPFKAKVEVETNKEEVKTDVNEIEQHFKKQLGGQLHIKIGTTTNAFDVIDLIRKEYKRSKEELENGKGILLKYKLSIEGLEQLNVLKMLSMTKGNIFDYLRLKSLQEDAIKKKEAEELARLNNFTLTDPTKGKNKGGGKQEDKWLKTQRERLKELENFYKRYKEFAEYLSEEDAIQKALDSDVFKGKNMPKNINDYLQVLKDFRKEYEAGMGNKASTERKGFLSDLNLKIDEKAFDEGMKKVAEVALKSLDEQLKEQGKRWDLYKKVLDATGSLDLSSQLAFGGSVSFGNIVEELRLQIEDAMKKLPKGSGVSVDELLGMDDKELHALGITEKAENGIYKMLKKLKEESIKLKEVQIESWLEAYKATHDYEIELGNIQVKYKRLIDAVEAQRTDENSEQTDKIIQGLKKASAKAMADLNWKRFKEEEEFGRIFGNLDNMSSTTLDNMLRKLHELVPTVNESVEATKALYEAMDKINDVMIDRNPFAGLSESLYNMSRINFYKGEVDKKGDILANKELAKILGVKLGSTVTKGMLNDAGNKQTNNFNKSLKSLGNKFKAVESALEPVIDLFETLGNTDLSQFFQIGNNALSAAASTADAIGSISGMFKDDSAIGKVFKDATPYAAAAGAALSVISSIAAMHDAALQKEIEASQQRQKEMENLSKNLETLLNRTLGGVYNVRASDNMLNELGKMIGKQRFSLFGGMKSDYSADTKDAYNRAVQTRSYYDSVRASLYAQRDEINKQYKLESDKKKADSGKLSDYKQSLKEIEDELKHFAEDMAKALYDIDVKSWAEDLGDAIVNAWARGEDAMKAWKDKAAELMADLTKNIIVQKVIEGQLNDVLDKVVNEMNAKSGKLDQDSITTIAKSLVAASSSAVSNTTNLLDAMDAEYRSMFGRSLKDVLAGDSSSDSGRNVIRGEFTEQETGLILSYINAIRADDAIIRTDVTAIRFILESYFAGGNSVASAQLDQQRQIAANTLRSAETAARIEELLVRATSIKDFGFYVH